MIAYARVMPRFIVGTIAGAALKIQAGMVKVCNDPVTFWYGPHNYIQDGFRAISPRPRLSRRALSQGFIVPVAIWGHLLFVIVPC